MENASKALLIAAEIIIGVLIISVGGVLYSIFGSASSDIVAQIESSKLMEFNSNFTKYYNLDSISAYDIVSIANLAKKYNTDSGYVGNQTPSDSSDYIQVYVIYFKNRNPNNKGKYEHFENQTEEIYNKFIIDNGTKKNSQNEVETVNYKCTSIEYNSTTGKVNKIVITEI